MGSQPALGTCSPALLHPSQMGHPRSFLPQEASSCALSGSSLSQPGHPCWPAWQRCRRVCRNGTGQVREAVGLLVRRRASLRCCPCHSSSAALGRREIGESLISLPKEAETALRVTLRSWSILLGGLCHTCFSHANHTQPGLGEELCSAQSPGRLPAAQRRRHVVQHRQTAGA